MNTETRTTLNLPADLAKQVTAYWHTAQLRSQNEAIRELIRAGLDAKLPKLTKGSEKRR